MAETLGAILMVIVAGLIMGAVAWPVKLMKHFKYEHWAFCAMVTGLVIIPWTVTLLFCPNAIAAYRSVDSSVIIKSNIFSLSWGMANVLGFLCLIRIGFSLTNGILTGVGVSLGVTVPMIFKGSGLFQNAPDLTSKPGLVVMLGVLVMVTGVMLASLSGFRRSKELEENQEKSGSFLLGLTMVILGGILSCGISFSFVYSQGPIKAVMMAEGASDIPATFSVWAIGLLGGALVNILFPAFLITKNKSWKVFLSNKKEVLLSIVIGINFCMSIALMGKGMILLGVLGASVGFGIQQAMQMFGGQGVGFISGEWRGVSKKTLVLICSAILLLILAAIIMSCGNALVRV